MAGNSWNGWKQPAWLEMAGNGWKVLETAEMADMVGNVWNGMGWLGNAGND